MDNEIKGEGNHIAYAERGYDPRIGRWISIDAYAPLFASHSPYNYALNNPIYLVDAEGNWPKPSNLLPADTSPLIKGMVDGVWEGLTGSVGFVVDYASNPQFREQVNASFKALVNDPIGTLGTIVDEYAGLIDRTLSGNATDEDKYNLGSEIGEGAVGIVLSGGALLAAKVVKKIAKVKIAKGRIADKAKTDVKKATKKQDPNKPNGFYDIRGVDNETIYVGKGPSKRAGQSLKVNQGNKVISYEVLEGVGGLNVRQTAFAFEELLLKKAESAGATLNNIRSSPGKKILKNLEKTSPKAFEKVKEAFNKKIAEGGKEIKSKT
jgi:RHS repeat-associated protein